MWRSIAIILLNSVPGRAVRYFLNPLHVDYSLSPPPRSSVRTACARTQVTFGPAASAPAPVDRPMDTSNMSIVCCVMHVLVKYILYIYKV